jgi:anthranilate synthase component I
MVSSASFLSDVVTPIALFAQLRQAQPYAFLLESTEGDTRLARYSIIGWQPRQVVVFKGPYAFMQQPDGTTVKLGCDDPLAFLQDLPASRNQPIAGLPFTGGWVGYLGYAAVASFDEIPLQPADPYQVPTGVWGDYDTVVVFDHLTRQLHLVAPPATFEQARQQLLAALRSATPLPPLAVSTAPSPTQTDLFAGVEGPFTAHQYCQAVEQCKDLIQAGEVFQIVLAHRFSKPFTGDPLQVYRLLSAINPSPYAFYLQCPEFTYLGASPETCVRVQQGEVMLKALAGTRPRGATPAEDAALEVELLANAKELAEHYMLVDLARNDLGRVCQVGTVTVGPIAQVHRYTHVMHLATEVTGQMSADYSAFDVARSCFPRGTLSGAPKIRAMQHLATLEPEQRGIYSGLVGYFDPHGDMDACIAIRSALLKDGWAHVQAGAGVVYDSVPADEYEETRNKAASVMKALYLYEQGLIEQGALDQ